MCFELRTYHSLSHVVSVWLMSILSSQVETHIVIPLVKKEIVCQLIEIHNYWKQSCHVCLFSFLLCAFINIRPPRSCLHQLVLEWEVILRREF